MPNTSLKKGQHWEKAHCSKCMSSLVSPVTSSRLCSMRTLISLSFCRWDLSSGLAKRKMATSLDAGVPVSGFYRDQGDLESIFMQITSHEKEKVVLTSEE